MVHMCRLQIRFLASSLLTCFELYSSATTLLGLRTVCTGSIGIGGPEPPARRFLDLSLATQLLTATLEFARAEKGRFLVPVLKRSRCTCT